MITLTDLCAELRNYFDRGMPHWLSDFEITNGNIVLPDGASLLDGQYFRIAGSVFNDGVHQYPADDLTDEPSFHGMVGAMAVPPSVIALMGEINEWETQYGSEVMKPYSSENISGVYSYTRASGGGGDGGSAPSVTWQDMFMSRLNKWRKI